MPLGVFEILKKMKIINWAKNNKLSIVLIIALISLLAYHYWFTINPPIVQHVMEVKTVEKVLNNGQVAQIKESTKPTSKPIHAGFSKAYLEDTINKILGIKNKQILALNQIKGRYQDSLNFVRSINKANKSKIRKYQRRNKAGKVISTLKITDDTIAEYHADISLTSVIRKAENRKERDSLIFYDPTQRITIDESREFRYALPKKRSKLQLGISVGAGVVIPMKKGFKPDLRNTDFGYFIGPTLTFTF